MGQGGLHLLSGLSSSLHPPGYLLSPFTHLFIPRFQLSPLLTPPHLSLVSPALVSSLAVAATVNATGRSRLTDGCVLAVRCGAE